ARISLQAEQRLQISLLSPGVRSGRRSVLRKRLPERRAIPLRSGARVKGGVEAVQFVGQRPRTARRDLAEAARRLIPEGKLPPFHERIARRGRRARLAGRAQRLLRLPPREPGRLIAARP